MTILDRVAETEYVLFRDPSHTVEREYGTFISHPDYSGRYDCNQMFNCRCPAGRVEDFLNELDRLYVGKPLGFRKLSGHDEGTLAVLEPVLSGRGWEFSRTLMMTLGAEPVISANPAVEVRAVDPFHPDLELQYTRKLERGTLDQGFAYYRTQQARLGGEWLVAYIDGKPVGTTYWFVVDRVAGFTWVGTLPEYRRRGVASSLILHVQNHPKVRAQDTLAISCNSEPTIRLYEKLGFRGIGWLWEAMRFDEHGEGAGIPPTLNPGA